MLRTAWKVFRGVGTAALLGSLGLQVWDRIGPDEPKVGAARRDAAEAVVPGIVENIRGTRTEIRSAALLDLENDDSGYLTGRLRSAIEESGAVNLRDEGLGRSLRDRFGTRGRQSHDAASAAEAGRRLGVDMVIFGKVRRFETTPEGGVLDADVRVVDVAAGKVLLEKSYVKEPAKAAGPRAEPGVAAAGPGAAPEGGGWWSGAKRCAAWALVILLLPVFTIGFVRAMARRDSNAASLGTVLVYTAADVALALLVLASGLSWGWAAAAVVLAAGLAFVWNGFVMRWAMRLEGQL